MASHPNHLDASQVLAAALEQMDDIIAGTKEELQNNIMNGISPNGLCKICDHSQTSSIALLMDKLKLAIERQNADDNDNKITNVIDPQTANFVSHWLEQWIPCNNVSNGQTYDHEELQAKIVQLETEKENLLLQVNVLTEQVEAQNEKIVELENTLSTNKEQLCSSEAMLRQEMSSRSSLENNKLDLMAQVSALRLQLATAEQERLEFEEKSKKLEGELVLTYACLAEKEADLATLKSKMSRNGTVIPLSDGGCEVDKLKSALSSVMAANDEKEKKIQELQVSLNRYKKLQELVLSGHNRRGSDGLSTLDPSNKAAFIEDSFKDKNCLLDSSYSGRIVDKPPPVPRHVMRPSATSSPIPSELQSSFSDDKSFSSPISPVKSSSLSNTLPSSLCQRSSSSENMAPASPQKTPPSRRHYETLPRQHDAEVLQQVYRQLQREKLGTDASNLSDAQKASHLTPEKTSQSFHNLHHPSLDTFRSIKPKASGASFGKGFFRLKSSKRSSSAPELAAQAADTARDAPDSSKSPVLCDRGASTPVPPLDAHEKPRGIKKIFGKLKRTGSENLDATEAEFKRGGLRATAGPRLGWAREVKNIHNENMPFPQWNSSMIADWFHNLGLGSYVTECKKSVKNGEHLLKCTPYDLEKELGIKNTLHRKKLLLALNEIKEKADELSKAAGKLDYHWIIRWLDDIGLPQYKDVFFDACIDGRILHHLTVDDMFALKVTNQLHHISIKRGIQVLRENNFGSHCLKRRSLPDDDLSPFEVSRWTNHRVMEWLRTVDLSEYAPNLRGSGVHGALMVYEPRFNADLLATLLNIPPNKTLLRRHLSTQFKQLVGSELMQKKRECEADPHYSPLSPSAKIKAVRRGQFSLLRKRNKGEVDFEDLVCPLNISEKLLSPVSSKAETKAVGDNQSKANSQQSVNEENESENSSVKVDTSKTEKILTDTLPDGKFFEALATTNV